MIIAYKIIADPIQENVIRKEKRNMEDAPAWIKKYLIILSTDRDPVFTKGKNPIRDSSNPIQAMYQLLLLITINLPIKFNRKNKNHEGFSFIII